MQIIVAIDIGATGAIALLDIPEARQEVVDMPVVLPERRKGGKKPSPLVDGRRLAKMLRGLDPNETIVVIEKVGAMPGQGVTSMFNFGNSAGTVRGVVEALGFKIVFVTPQQWKKAHRLIGTEKDAARVLALKKFPALASRLKRKKDGGRGDALLIADWYASSTVH